MVTNELLTILNDYFKWNKARMKCFSEMILALIKVRTVNLVDLACAFESTSKKESRYKRLKRFFSKVTIDFAQLAVFIVHLFGFIDKKIYLSMDRTNWCWGKSNINILMLSAVYKGVALPLLWCLLPKNLFKIFLGCGGKRFIPEEAGFRITFPLAAEGSTRM